VQRRGCFGWEYKGKGKDLSNDVRPLELAEIKTLIELAKLDWSTIKLSIFSGLHHAHRQAGGAGAAVRRVGGGQDVYHRGPGEADEANDASTTTKSKSARQSAEAPTELTRAAGSLPHPS